MIDEKEDEFINLPLADVSEVAKSGLAVHTSSAAFLGISSKSFIRAGVSKGVIKAGVFSKLLKGIPRYRCHKEVSALKITHIIPNPRGCELHFGEGWVPIEMPHGWVERTNAEAGGYYVVYADGYESFSPAAAFDEGYTLIAGDV